MKLWHTERKPPTTIAAINEKRILYQIRKINVCNIYMFIHRKAR